MMAKKSSVVRHMRLAILLVFFFLPLLGLTLTEAQPFPQPTGPFEVTVIDFDEFPGAIIAQDGTIDSAIILAKETHPAGSAQTFSFVGDVNGSMTHGQALLTIGLVPGFYFSTEQVPPGWRISSITCSDSNSAGSIFGATAFFNLQAGEIVICLFVNEEIFFADGFESGNTDAWTATVP